MPPKTMRPLNPKTPSYKQPMQHDVEKAQARDKIQPNKIFEQYSSKPNKKNNKRSNQKKKSKY